jgi:hypothetical protein
LGPVFNEPLTKSTLFDLPGHHGKHTDHLCHNFDENAQHGLGQWYLFCINTKTREEIADAIEEVDNGVITCTNASGGLT